jgi:uncharacterized DUF497 family protein
MRFSWDERKRELNLADHEIDFVDASKVFAGLTATFEDDRFEYGEQRFVTLGFLDGVPVSIAHTESSDEIRVISFRRATRNEEKILFESIEDQLPKPPQHEAVGRKADRRTPGTPRKANRARDRPKGPQAGRAEDVGVPANRRRRT